MSVPRYGFRPQLFRIVVILSLVCCAGLAQVRVSVASGSAVAGGAASLNISLTSGTGGAPAAVEWILNYSANDLSGLTLQAGPSATAARKSLSCGTNSGSIHCVISGVDAATVANGVIATAKFTVSSKAAASSALQITGAKAATPAAASLAAVGSG